MNNKGKICYANRGKGKPDQDVKWYTSKSNAAVEAAQLGFTNATGALIDYGGGNLSSIPGIMTLNFIPTIGERFTSSTDPRWAQNAFNLTFRRQYTQMRRKNTASPVYNAPDLGIYTYAIDSLYAFHAYCARAYKLINFAKNKNKYYADIILRAMQINADDLRSNAADFRIWLNNFAERINGSLSVAKLPLFERHYWINSHIWKDGDTEKSQLYLPKLTGYFKYDATYAETGGGLRLVDYFGSNFGTHIHTTNELKAFGEELLSALLNDDDILLIAADVDKWYGGNQFLLPTVSENEKYEPEYSLEVLTQIQNTTVFTGYAGGDLQQNVDLNSVIQNLTLLCAYNGSASQKMKPFITMPFDQPKPEDIVVATRNLVAVTEHSTITVTAFSSGSEVCVNADIVYYDAGGDPESYSGQSDEFICDTLNSNMPGALLLINLFDMHPPVYGSEDVTAVTANVYTEFENSTPVSAERLNQIHVMSCLNEFGFYDVDQGNRE